MRCSHHDMNGCTENSQIFAIYSSCKLQTERLRSGRQAVAELHDSAIGSPGTGAEGGALCLTSEFAFPGMDRRKRILDLKPGGWRSIACCWAAPDRWSRDKHTGATPPPRLAHRLPRLASMRRITSCCSRPSSWRRRTGSWRSRPSSCRSRPRR